MWLFTKLGYFSIGNKNSGAFHVRARRRLDLENLRHVSEIAAPVVSTPDGDYPFRLIVNQGELDGIFTALAGGIDYESLKNSIEDSHKLDCYYKIWMLMCME